MRRLSVLRLGRICGLLVLLLACSSSPVRGGEPKTLTILHFNDFHGQLEPIRDRATGKSRGGIARLATLVGRIRAEDPARPVLLLFAGDLLQGTVSSTVFLGSPDVQIFGEMGVDAAAMGNHELDYGQDVFRSLLAEARFPILAANLRAEPEPFPALPAVVLTPRGGPRVGVLGLVTDELTTTTHPRNTGGISVANPIETARGWVPWLKSRSDLVLVLSHLGLAADKELARSVPGIGVIVGGHNHFALQQPETVEGVPIVQAGDRGLYLGRLDLSIHDGRADVLADRLIPVDDSIPEDAGVAARLRALTARLNAEIDQPVGTCATLLDARREIVRRVESNFGDWVGDLARGLTGTDVAIFNGGTFRTSIEPGVVRIRDLYQAFPFGNELIKAHISGAALKEALDRSASLNPDDNPGGFLQVSGLRFTVRNGRAESIDVGDRPLDPQASYRIVMPEFLAAGGDGYAMLKDLPDAVPTGLLVLDMVRDAFRAQPNVSAGTDGRIVRK